VGVIKKEMIIGVLAAFFVTSAGVFLYLEYISEYGFNETLKMIKEGDLAGKIITLAAIPNMIVFFIFIKKKQDYRARGVLLATILIAFLTLILQFL